MYYFLRCRRPTHGTVILARSQINDARMKRSMGQTFHSGPWNGPASTMAFRPLYLASIAA